MNVLTTPLGVIGLFAVMFLLWIFANLSQRLGAVTKMKPYYRGFYVAIVLVGVAVLARLMRGSVTFSPQSATSLENDPLFYLIVYYAPYVIAAVIGVVIAWLYWSWLFKEKRR